MAYQCFHCQKKNWSSTRSQHHKGVAGGQWKHKAQKSAKLFRANLHKVRVMLDDTIERIKLCTDCLSLLRKNKEIHSGKYMIKKLAFAVETPVVVKPTAKKKTP